MAKKSLTHEQWETLRERAFRAARGSRLAVETFAETIEAIHDSGLWREEARSDGSTFATFREFAEYRYPPGLSMSADHSGIPVEGIIEQLVAANPNRPAIDYLGGKRSTGKPTGRPKKVATAVATFRDANTAGGMADRLERDHKPIWAAYKRGEYASLTEAARAAGLRKSSHLAMDRARQAWNRMTVVERKKFAAMVSAAGTDKMEGAK